jgi:hypothetical protein
MDIELLKIKINEYLETQPEGYEKEIEKSTFRDFIIFLEN